jgi:hypothetical protein
LALRDLLGEVEHGDVLVDELPHLRPIQGGVEPTVALIAVPLPHSALDVSEQRGIANERPGLGPGQHDVNRGEEPLEVDVELGAKGSSASSSMHASIASSLAAGSAPRWWNSCRTR